MTSTSGSPQRLVAWVHIGEAKRCAKRSALACDRETDCRDDVSGGERSLTKQVGDPSRLQEFPNASWPSSSICLHRSLIPKKTAAEVVSYAGGGGIVVLGLGRGARLD